MAEDPQKKSNRGSILGLALASYGAALVALITSLVLTRVMSPEDFGAYRYVVVVIGFAAVVANLGLPYSAAKILTGKNVWQQPSTMAASLQLLLCSVFLVGLVIAIFATLTLEYLAVSSLLLAAAFLVWTTTFQRHFEYMLRGVGGAKEMAFQKLAPPTLTLVFAATITIWNPRISLANILVIIGISYLTTHFVTASRLKVWKVRYLSGARSEIIVAQKTVGVPIYKGALLSVGIAELVLVLGGGYVGELAFGSFALAISMAGPVATLPSAIAMVQFRRFGVDGRLQRKTLYSTVLYSSALGIATVSIGWFIFPLLFPSGFDDAKMMFPILAIGFLFHGLADYLNQFLQAQGLGHSIKRGTYVVGFVSVLVAVITIPFIDVWGLVATKVISSGFYVLVMFVLMRRRNRESI